jgi:hypothetical protein
VRTGATRGEMVSSVWIAGIESPLDRLSQPRKKPRKAKERGSKDQPTA